MKLSPLASISGLATRAFETLIRGMVGCFVLTVVLILAVGFAAYYRHNPFQSRLPAVGPRAPIPQVAPATIAAGRVVYRREGCHACHTLADPPPSPGDAPDLTHEGRRNADIGWQRVNLTQHHRLFPNSVMADEDDLSPADLQALASYLATRR